MSYISYIEGLMGIRGYEYNGEELSCIERI